MNEIVLCLLSGGVAAAVIKAVESMITWKLNRKATKEDKQEERQIARDKLQIETIEALQECVEQLRRSDRAILHDRIKYLGRAYIRNEKIDFDDRQDLIDMHSIYHNDLDGNGNLDSLMAEVMKLPVE